MTNIKSGKNMIKFAAVSILLSVAAAGFAIRFNASGQTKPVTASERFKNIKVLNDVPADEIGTLMNIMSASLDVNCKFCHTSNNGDFEKDDNEHKEIAREMIKMTFAINRQFFYGRPEVTCNTCHNGRPHPAVVPDLTAPPRQPRAQAQPVKYTIDQVIGKYEKALGRRSKIDAVKSRRIDAVRIEPDGKTTEPETVYQSPGRIRVETLYGNYLVIEGFDGETAWKSGNGSPILLKPFEAEQIAREARLYANPDIKSVYTTLDVKPIEKINGRNVVPVAGTLANGRAERLYFDESSGLLVRRVASTPTVLGDFQFQTDYLKYRSYGGMKLPTLTRFAVPNISWTRRVNSVRVNVLIDERLFDR